MKSTPFFLCTISLAIVIFGYFFISSTWLEKRIVDEKVHTTQTQRIYKDQPEIVKRLTNLTGYHQITAGILTISQPVFRFKSVKSYHVRAVAIFYTVILFALVLYISWYLSLPRRLSLFALCVPILSPYLFLAYTEVLSLIFVLLTLILYLQKRHHLSATMILLAILVRQDNVVWVGFFLALGLVPYFSMHCLRHWKISALSYLRQHSLFFLCAFLFAVFFAINGGVAVGDQEAHPTRPDLDNIFFFFIIAAIILLPTLLFEVKKIWTYTLQNKTLTIAASTILGVGYTTTFNLDDHSYNANDRFLHNLLGHYFSLDWLGMVIGICLSIFLLVYFLMKIFKWKNITLGLVLLFSFVSLSLHPLVEHRYMVIPLILILFFLGYTHKKLLLFQIVYCAAISGFLYWIVFFERIYKL